jgi:hypothetical protein
VGGGLELYNNGPGDFGYSSISYHAEGDIATSGSELIEWGPDIDEPAESWSSVDDPVEWGPYVDGLAGSYSFVDVKWEPEPELWGVTFKSMSNGKLLCAGCGEPTGKG